MTNTKKNYAEFLMSAQMTDKYVDPFSKIDKPYQELLSKLENNKLSQEQKIDEIFKMVLTMVQRQDREILMNIMYPERRIK